MRPGHINLRALRGRLHCTRLTIDRSRRWLLPLAPQTQPFRKRQTRSTVPMPKTSSRPPHQSCSAQHPCRVPFALYLMSGSGPAADVACAASRSPLRLGRRNSDETNGCPISPPACNCSHRPGRTRSGNGGESRPRTLPRRRSSDQGANVSGREKVHISRFAARTSANSASGWLTMVATMMPLMISDQAVFQ
jgi:hypothetical protein